VLPLLLQDYLLDEHVELKVFFFSRLQLLADEEHFILHDKECELLLRYLQVPTQVSDQLHVSVNHAELCQVEAFWLYLEGNEGSVAYLGRQLRQDVGRLAS